MYLDFEDHRPETPRIDSAISVREGVLLSFVAHLAVVLFVLFAPTEWLLSPVTETVQPEPRTEPLRYVEVLPAIDREALARSLADLSDMDRRSETRERAPDPENQEPLSFGTTPEKIEAVPEMRAAGPESPVPGSEPEPPPILSDPVPPPDPLLGPSIEPLVPPAPTQMARGNLGDALRNLERYLQNENFDNELGGDTDQRADIQFDSKGVDFGPWLRRFVNQIRRNWLIPKVAELTRGRVVVEFTVLRNGTIIGLRAIRPADEEALTVSSMNAIRLSNPTAALPVEFPDDRAPFIVTFHYNESRRDGR